MTAVDIRRGDGHGGPARGPARTERVAASLNRALHAVLAADATVQVLGQDILDPYGGAFRVTKGLSTRFPDRVVGTPISEGATLGVAAGLALCGHRPIVEVMFGDFLALGFDQLLNFLTKSVSMYGRRVPMPVVVRCPVGGNRGYGPTHSQSPQKHFIGIPHLALFELSPFHDAQELLTRLVARAEPCLLFEDKTLYGERTYADGVVDDLFSYDMVAGTSHARVFIEAPDVFDVVLIAPGGLTQRVLAAARDLFLEAELRCQVIVPVELHPFDLDPLIPTLVRAELVGVVEEGTAGGTWGSGLARLMYERLWRRLRRPILLVNSVDSVIPTAAHLEREVLVQATTIFDGVRKAAGV